MPGGENEFTIQRVLCPTESGQFHRAPNLRHGFTRIFSSVLIREFRVGHFFSFTFKTARGTSAMLVGV